MIDEPDQEDELLHAPQHIADVVPVTLQKRVRSASAESTPSKEPSAKIAEQKALETIMKSSAEATMPDAAKETLADHLHKIIVRLSPDNQD